MDASAAIASMQGAGIFGVELFAMSDGSGLHDECCSSLRVDDFSKMLGAPRAQKPAKGKEVSTLSKTVCWRSTFEVGRFGFERQLQSC